MWGEEEFRREFRKEVEVEGGGGRRRNLSLPLFRIRPILKVDYPLGWTHPYLSDPQATEGAVDLAEQTRVLGKRKGRTLGRRTILKSYVDHSQVWEEVWGERGVNGCLGDEAGKER